MHIEPNARVDRLIDRLRTVIVSRSPAGGCLPRIAGPGPLFLSAPPAGAPGVTAANSEPSLRNCTAFPAHTSAACSIFGYVSSAGRAAAAGWASPAPGFRQKA